MPIRKLPLLIVNQIAAGEVIERPASVVKELVENSLDAGATRLDITVADGGRELIRVSDNGTGIDGAELTLAVTPHATSKLAAPSELAGVNTLGFRGEALASIASVSRLGLTSRATVDGQRSQEAWAIEASGDDVHSHAPAACSAGTIVTVRDLFFNTPVRRKFLRGAATEFGHIGDVVTRIAMVCPSVSFTLTHNGRKTIDVPANQLPRQRCLDLMGVELDQAMLDFEQVRHEVGVRGLAGLPSVARATGKFQYLSVNGRPVRDRMLSHAVREAYRGLMPPDRQPVCVVMLEVGLGEVDVNVHPTKAEVRFSKPNHMHGMILTAIRQCLLGHDLTPTVSLDATPLNQSVSAAEHVPSPSLECAADSGAAYQRRALGSGGPPGTSRGSTSDLPDRFAESFRCKESPQKGFKLDEVRRTIAPQAPVTSPTEPVVGDQFPLPVVLQSQGILQVHKTYLVTEDEQGLLIVDQHALHERVLFEQLRERVIVHDLESQCLLMPAVIEADSKRMALFAELKPLLKRIGIETEPIGPTSMAIQAFACFLFERKVDPAEFVQELLDKVDEGLLGPNFTGDNAEEAAIHKVLDMMACKAAVKAGDKLKPQELSELLSKRDHVERSSACPHGRPTTIRLTMRDLARHFKRT